MTKLGKNNQKRLAKLVAAALMCAGGGLFSPPSVASAEEVTVSNVTGSNPLYDVTSDGGMMNPPGARFKDVWYPISANVLNITGTFNADAIKFYGGYDAGAFGKTVNIKGTGTDIAVGTIAGGWANGNYSVTGNHVNFLGGTTTVSEIYGGDGVNGANVSKNHVNIAEGSTIKYKGYGVAICGGKTNFGNGGSVDANTVTISGTLATAVPSASLGVTVAGGVATTGDGKNVTGNMVEIKGATFNTGANDGVAIYGGYNNGPNGNATGNTVTISGNSTFGDAAVEIYGGQSGSGAANDNTVEISGGTINGYIYGGMGSTEASGNTVTISGDAIINALDSAYIYGGTGAPIAKNNTINILTQISVRGLYGGIDSSAGDGNTLNIAAKGVTVGSDGLNSFQNLNFYLPTDMTTSDTMLTVNGTAYVTDAKVGVMAQGKLENLTTDNKVTLLSAETLTGGDTITQAATSEIVVPTGLTTSDKYEFTVANEGNTIVATITKDDSGSGGGDDPVNPTNPDDDIKKSPVEVRAATVTMLNAGADMLASQGFAQAANAVAIEAAEQAKTGAAEGTNGAVGAPVVRSFTPFAAFGGSSLRAESGSHVDTKGFGINVGFAKEFSNSQGKLLFGPVVEYGGGKYDSYNNDVHGDGNSHYWGFGLMARQTNHDGFYYEGSVRFGRVTSDYSANLPTDVHAFYDSASNYWAAHLGLGKIFATGKQDTVDAYLKYFYSHQGGDDTDITLTGKNARPNTQHASFDSIDSNRIRIGARLTHKINDMNSLYGGLAYQYEFGGEARAHYAGLGEAPSPSVKGSSGMLELGWQVKPNNGPVTIDLGVTGWAGKQRGGSVQLGATWTF